MDYHTYNSIGIWSLVRIPWAGIWFYVEGLVPLNNLICRNSVCDAWKLDNSCQKGGIGDLGGGGYFLTLPRLIWCSYLIFIAVLYIDVIANTYGTRESVIDCLPCVGLFDFSYIQLLYISNRALCLFLQKPHLSKTSCVKSVILRCALNYTDSLEWQPSYPLRFLLTVMWEERPCSSSWCKTTRNVITSWWIANFMRTNVLVTIGHGVWIMISLNGMMTKLSEMCWTSFTPCLIKKYIFKLLVWFCDVRLHPHQSIWKCSEGHFHLIGLCP